MDQLRILVTGSRDWTDVRAVEQAINRQLPLAMVLPGAVVATVIHGDCPTGADKIAKDYAEQHPYLKQDPHPAKWKEHGKGAGPKRNQEMVELGADVCIAFVLPCKKEGCRIKAVHDSHGTADCIKRAKKAGIKVVEVRPERALV
jgi:hypothetical protein